MTTKVSLIADSSVTGAAINNLTITSDDIANNAVTTDKINFGTALVPLGGIIMWSGITAPSGYQLCNGSDLPSTSPLRPGITNTPDLRDRFIVGAGSQTYPIGATGGANSVVLGTNNVPAHNHGVSNFSNPGDHQHYVTAPGSGQKMSNHRNDLSWAFGSSGFVGDDSRQDYTGSANNITANSGASSPSGGHTHTFDINNAFGNAQGGTDAHENRPPYYALALIMRVA